MKIQHIADRWTEMHGRDSLALLTGTIPHHKGEALRDSWQDLQTAWSKSLTAGEGSKRFRSRWGIRHFVRTWDITFGSHGWHIHFHTLLLFDRGLSDQDLSVMRDELARRYADQVERRGRPRPHPVHGVHVERASVRPGRGHAALSQYLTKVALEMARGDLKESRSEGGRTPWRVLADFAETGDLQDLEIWTEYEQASKGRRFMRCSDGLGDLVAVDQADLGEVDELEEVGGAVLHTLTEPEAAALQRLGVTAVLMALERTEEAGVEALRAFLTECVARAAPPDRRRAA